MSSSVLMNLVQETMRAFLVKKGVRSKWETLLGHPVHYYLAEGQSKGPGAPPVVLVHGLGGSSTGFARVLGGLCARFPRVFALDFPGSGFSPLPATGPLTLEEMLHVLHGFVRTVVQGPCLLVGNSLGGALSLTYATRWEEDVRALVLVSPGGAQVSRERHADLLATFDLKTAASARSMVRRLFHRPSWPSIAFANTVTSIFRTPSVRSIVAEVQSSPGLTPELLHTLAVPTLLIWGKSEKLLPYEGLEFFRAHLPSHVKIEVVEGFGHVPQVERPKELVARVVEFWEAEAGRPRVGQRREG
jgi:pimeloyl-ACP methyl ester carboxylesterase